MTESRPMSSLIIGTPAWLDDVVDWRASYATDDDRMQLAIEIARQNVVRGTGGPFGAAVFERESGALVSVGMNSVVRLHNSTLHAEMLAIMLAEKRIGAYSLHGAGIEHELVSSRDPCAMCLGAMLWSGVRRVVTGADRADASALDFDEGPVFPESYTYLESRGLTIVRGVLRDEARGVLELYRRKGGVIYNA